MKARARQILVTQSRDELQTHSNKHERKGKPRFITQGTGRSGDGDFASAMTHRYGPRAYRSASDKLARVYSTSNYDR